MNRSNHERQATNGFARIVALVLAVSLLLIPVELPFEAAAASISSDAYDQTYVTEDFADSDYVNGLSYYWDEQMTDDSDASVARGTYNITIGKSQNKRNYIILNGETSEWTDYTVSMDLYKDYLSTPEEVPEYHPGIMLCARMSYDEEHGGYSYYAVKSRVSSGIFLVKRWYNPATGKFVDSSIGKVSGVDQPDKAWRNLSITVDGNLIIAEIADPSGKTRRYTWEDDGVLYGPVLEKGGVGMYCECESKNETWKAKVDNFKVVMKDGSVAFNDEFVDNRYERGVEYQWSNPEVQAQAGTMQWVEEVGANTVAGIRDGAYFVDPASGTNRLWLKTETTDLLTGKKVNMSDTWTDYTVEFDWKGDYSEYVGVTSIPGVSLIARMNYDEEHGDYQYYNIKLHPGNGCYVLKYYYDETQGKWMITSKDITGKSFLKAFNGNYVSYFADGGVVHAKITVKNVANGVSIEATLTDSNGNILNYAIADASGKGGNKGTTGSAVDDGSATGDRPYTEGGAIGLLFESGKYTCSVDNFTLTLDGETEPIFKEDFSNRNYFNGVPTVYNPSGVELWPLQYSSDIKFNWNTELMGNNIVDIKNGALCWDVNNQGKAFVTIDSVAKDPVDSDIVFDPASQWSDYTIDMDIKAEHPTTGTLPGIMAVGRVQYDRYGNVTGYYAVKVHETNGVAILKCYIDKETGKWVQDGIGAGYSRTKEGSAGINGNDRHLSVKFANTASGVMITVTLTDMEGNSVLKSDSFSVIDDGTKIGNWQKQKLGAPYMSGTMGFELESLNFDWKATIDNYSVTLAGATEPVFLDTFTPGKGQTTQSYLEQGQTAKDGLVEMEYVFPDIWKIENGVMNVENLAPRINLFKIGAYYANRTNYNDYAAEMMNYTVDVDVMLKNDSSYASAVANYTDNSYYEARVTANDVTLYQIIGEEEIVLQRTEKRIDTNTWYSLKLEVSRNGKTVRVFCDYELVAEIKSVPNACKMGYMGLKASGNVSFDNFSVCDTNISDGRPFDTYKFYLSNLSELAPNWNVSGVTSWTVKNNRLVNVGSATTASNLLLKDVTAYTDYCVTSIGVMAENGQMGVIGRYSDGNFYKLVLDAKNKDLVLTRVKDGISTELDRVPGEFLYQEGITIDGGEEYELKLYMYGESLMAYINGELAISLRDTALTSGAAGVLGTNGVALESVVVSEAMQPPVFTFVDANGKILTETKWVPKEEVDPSLWMNGVDLYEVEFDVGTADSPMHVPLGKYPDLTLMYLNVYDGVDTTIRVPVDTLEFDGLVCDELGLHQLEVYYEGYTAILYYETIDRTEEIKQLIRDIQGFSLMELPIEHAGDVYDLIERYEDLSYVEKQQVPDDVKRKLELAKECVLVMTYGYESLGELIFFDNFDTAESEDNYTADSDYNIIGETDPGNWFVMNGNMYQYDTNEVIHEGPGFSSAKLVKDKYYEVTSVSVDVMLMHPTAWAGIRFNSLAGNYYKYQLTTKNNDRMVLNKSGGLALYTRTHVDMPISQGGMGLDLKAYEWYTIRIVFDKDEGIIHCYINDRKVFSYKDENLTPVFPEVLTYGMAGFCMGEGWVRFDNFEIRGKEVENPGHVSNYYNTDLEPKEFRDDFNDEGANVGSDPSHWVEPSTANVWKAKKEGNNVFYGNTNNLNNSTATWLHVFERDTELTAKVRVNEVGKFANFGLLSRLIGSYSYIHAGYDFYLQKWYIEYQYGADFEKEYFYADETSPFTVGKWYEVKVRSVGTDIELYLDGKLMIKGDSGKMINPGRVGFAATNCNIDVDDVDLQQLSGQGRVEDGVMEQYTAHAGAAMGTLFNVFELQDGRFLMHEDNKIYISSDAGNTWEIANTKFKGGSFLRLHDGTILTIQGSKNVCIWDEATDTSTQIGTIPEGPSQNHSQPQEHVSEYQLEDGTWRIFFTVADQNIGNVDNVGTRRGVVDIFYSDDGGYTWTKSKTDIYTITSHINYCESHVVQLKKDVVDLTGRILPAGTLLDYTTYNADDSMRYHVSFDGGVTWEGDYAIPYITVCGMNTCTIEWDEETQAYYLATQYNIRGTLRSGHGRHRVALMRSYDGYNWEYLCDVDRWGDLSDTDRGHIMHCVNMYLDITDDYVFVCFSRSERFAETTHRIQEGRMFRFDKDKLTAYEEWPAEYAVKDNAIVSIEGISDDVMTQSNYSTEGIFKVYYYDGTTELVNLRDAIVSNDSLRLIREKDITIDYKFFRTVLRINVVDTKPTLITNPDEVFEVTLKGGGLAHFEVSRDQLGQFFSVFGDTAYVVLGDELIDAVDGKASGLITLSEAVMEQEAIDEVQGDTVLLVIGNRSEETKTFTVKFEKNENAGDQIPPSSSDSEPSGGDDEPEVPQLQPDMTLWIIVGLAGAVLVVGAVVILLVVNSRKKKSKKANQTPEENSELQEEQ